MNARAQISSKPALPAPSFTAHRGLLQRKCACSGLTGNCEECDKKKLQKAHKPVQRKCECGASTLASKWQPASRNCEVEPGNRVPPIVNEVLRSAGQPLKAQTRSFFEPRFGHDFSRVRVHTDVGAAESARVVNAQAYTVGNDIAFATGRYAPGTTIGDSLLAHELTHVVQQASSTSTQSYVDLELGQRDTLEREADQSASEVMAGGVGDVVRRLVPTQVRRASLQREQEEEDPIHGPIIETFRREHGLPLEDESPGEPPIGPSAAEIKYVLNVPPPTSVFYVSFQNVLPPSGPDHSQQNPGPPVSGVSRAGYTRVRVQKRASVAWETGPPASDGRIPLYAQSVNVFYRLDPIEVFVSSDYTVGSCPYRVTLEHERSHVEAFARLFYEGRALLVQDLSGLTVPTQAAPALVDPANVNDFQDALGGNLRSIINTHSAALVARMEADRQAKDSPAAYAPTYARCPPSEW